MLSGYVDEDKSQRNGIYKQKTAIKSDALFYNDSFYAAWDGGEDFVGDGVEDASQFGNRRVFTEDGDCVADLYIHSGHIEHRHVHADIAYRRRSVAVD